MPRARGVAVLVAAAALGCALVGCVPEPDPYRPKLAPLPATVETSPTAEPKLPAALTKVAAKKKAPLPVVRKRYASKPRNAGGTGSDDGRPTPEELALYRAKWKEIRAKLGLSTNF